MSSRPRPLNTEPSGKLTGHPNGHRSGLYAVPEEDPQFYDAQVWDVFKLSYASAGGNIEQCYRLATLDWDTERFGDPPKLESLRRHAKRNLWREELLQAILDNPARYQELSDANLDRMRPLADQVIEDALLGNLDPKKAKYQLDAARTLQYFATAGTMGRKFARGSYEAHKPPPPEPEAPPPPPSIEEVAEDRSLSWRSYKSKDQIHQGDSDE
jgi:hypothetical protein